MPTLTDEEGQNMGGKITEGEIVGAIRTAARGKTPGTDGFPIEFYSTYESTLTPKLMELYDTSREQGILPQTTREALIIPIPKPGKKPTDPLGYRPLSMLNSDYKILSRVLAARLLPHMPKLIHTDQTGFIPGRNTATNIRRLYRLLRSANRMGQRAAVALSVDIEKAFDSLEWEYLYEVMAKMKLGEGFINWTRLLYAGPTARVKTGNMISGVLQIQRGTRQGCPLSPLLFAIAMEPLAAWARSNLIYKGIRAEAQLHHIALYADDLLMFLQDPSEDLEGAMELLKGFGNISGLKMNWEKTCMFPLTKGQEAQTVDTRLRWEPDCLQYLGVRVYHTSADTIAGNITRAVNTLRESVGFWASLPLSVAGRIAVTKMIALPRLLYFFNTLPVWITRKTFRDLDSLLITFIWGTGRRRVALAKLQRTTERGGLAAPDMEGYYLAAQMQWCTRWVAESKEQERDKVMSRPSREILYRVLLRTQKNLPKGNEEFQVMARSWNRWLARSRTKIPYSPELPLGTLKYFAPKGPWRNLQNWKDLGVTKLGQLYRDREPLQYESLCEEYDLPNGDFLMHRAIIAAVRLYWSSGLSEPPAHNGLTYVVTSTGKYKAVTCLYRAIQNDALQPLDKLQEQWEKDLGTPIDPKKWDEVVARANKVTRNARFKLISFYTLHRAYLSPDKINKYFHRDDASCPRCLTVNADFLHMMWTCPHITEYWAEVLNTLTKITERLIPCTPLQCLLHGFPRTAKNKNTSRFLDLALVLAVREITQHWKAKRGPQYEKWRGETIKWAACEGRINRRERGQRGGAMESVDAWDLLVIELQDWNNEENERDDISSTET